MLNNELLNYIDKAKKTGKTDNQIYQELLGSGWSDE